MTDLPTELTAPWHPITNKRHLKVLGKLCEEVNELGKAIARCIIQGLDGVDPYRGSVNIEQLTDEIADVMANIELATKEFRLDTAQMVSRAQRKVDRLTIWLEQL